MKLTKLLAGTAISLAIGLGAVSANAKELTVVSWGGAYTKSQVEAYHKPFI
ncbi:MAG: ABC transporter substrate-binding protein, partial [Pseudomonadota bacterium]